MSFSSMPDTKAKILPLCQTNKLMLLRGKTTTTTKQNGGGGHDEASNNERGSFRFPLLAMETLQKSGSGEEYLGQRKELVGEDLQNSG